MARLLFLFVLVPAIELALLIEIGSRIGTFTTLAIIVVTGVLGAALARHEGFGVLRTVQERLARGELPADPLVEGALILAAGALLMTPGFLTDAIGFLCLIPPTRAVIRKLVWHQLRGMIASGRARIHVQADGIDASAGDPGTGDPGTGDPRRDPSKDVSDL